MGTNQLLHNYTDDITRSGLALIMSIPKSSTAALQLCYLMACDLSGFTVSTIPQRLSHSDDAQAGWEVGKGQCAPQTTQSFSPFTCTGPMLLFLPPGMPSSLIATCQKTGKSHLFR